MASAIPASRRRISIGHGVPPAFPRGSAESHWHKKIRDILAIRPPDGGPRGGSGVAGPTERKGRRRTVCCEAGIRPLERAGSKPVETPSFEETDRDREGSTASLTCGSSKGDSSAFAASVSSSDGTPPSPCERPSLAKLMNSSGRQCRAPCDANMPTAAKAAEGSGSAPAYPARHAAKDRINSPRRASGPADADAARSTRRASYNDMLNFASMFASGFRVEEELEEAGEMNNLEEYKEEEEEYVPPKLIKVDRNGDRFGVRISSGRECKPCCDDDRSRANLNRRDEPDSPKSIHYEPDDYRDDLSYISYAEEEGDTPQTVKADPSNLAYASFRDAAAYLRSLRGERAEGIGAEDAAPFGYEPKRGMKPGESPGRAPRPRGRASRGDAPPPFPFSRPPGGGGGVLRRPFRPEGAGAPRISVQVRRRSSLNADAPYDLPEPPFATERRYGRRGSEVSFHVPDKSSEALRKDGERGDFAGSKSPFRRNDEADRRASGCGAKRNGANLRRASDCGPRDFYAASDRMQSTRVLHPRIAKEDGEASVGSEESRGDRPPVSVIICKKPGGKKENREETRSRRSRRNDFAYC